MKTKLLFTIITVFTLCFIFSCNDLIEIDLTSSNITETIPTDNTLAIEFSQTFWWNELKGASNYNLQIVQPSFSSPRKFISDTLIQQNSFTLLLDPGVYEWRVRGENASSYTNYKVQTLTIDSSLNLSNQSVILSSPSDKSYEANLTQIFSWDAIPNVENYIFQLFSGNTAITTQTTPNNNITYTFAAEGAYSWKVIAQNTLTASQPSLTSVITIDTTKPQPITAIRPLLDTITANPIELTWNTTAPLSILDSTYASQLQISTDSTFATITTKDTLIINRANPIRYNFLNATIGQDYYWRVKGIDRAGNESTYFKHKRIKRN